MVCGQLKTSTSIRDIGGIRLVYIDYIDTFIDTDDNLKTLYFRLKRKFSKIRDCGITGGVPILEFNSNDRSNTYSISIWLENDSYIYIYFDGNNDYKSKPIKIEKHWREQPSYNWYTKVLWRKHWWIR